ncbi:MAG: type I DNA topoisomerase [Bacteroidales bacterium]|nr:type I DNA topoisomerase [Bacteroidales bacterium]
MEENLVIVESPEKARTIQNFLGKENFVVRPSKGHIRDLQDKKLSIDIEHGFTPEYVIPDDKKKIVSELKKLAKGAKTVWLASDEDREGEAISWHLAEALGLDVKTTKRIVFHEITKDAILNAIQNPRTINMDLVNAQQARRVLDRLVGFELSPVLWRKVQPKLSAGRVQSVALRLVVDREREILAFPREQYYNVEASFHPEGTQASVKVKAILEKKFKGMDEARQFLQDSIGAVFTVASKEQKEGARYPAPPFTTSTLQQEASRKLHFPVSLTMRIAQQLYERGLITYMRTDSTNLSTLAIGTAKDFIIKNFGEEYSKVRQFKTKTKGAQEAHEAIRPTFIGNTTIEGTEQEKKLYDLIWKRTVASQMADAKVLRTEIKVNSDKRSEKFIIQATEILFEGFLKLYIEGTDDAPEEEGEVLLPEIHEGDRMDLKALGANCKFTTPPPRYSDATLIKKLEELEIGRPSTYAPTITTLTTGRGYIIKGDKPGEKIPVKNLVVKGGKIEEVSKTETVGAEKGKLLPQEIGMIVTDFLTANFNEVMDYHFTASVEEDFDQIARGEKEWNNVISEFYNPFHKKVDTVLNDGIYNHVSRELGIDPSDGKMLVAKFGQWGPYIQKGEGEDRQFARLSPGQLIESITLEDALKLFQLPRTVGQHEGVDIIATKGRFGPYLKYGDKNVSIPKGKDPLNITLEECVALLGNPENGKASGNVVAEYKDIDVQVINGRYGLYIKHAGSNVRIPKGLTAADLTAEKCQAIISGESSTGGSSSTQEVILEYKDIDVQVINGKYGPYIKHAGANYRIPKEKVAKDLSLQECNEIISGTPTGSSARRSKFSKTAKKKA